MGTRTWSGGSAPSFLKVPRTVVKSVFLGSVAGIAGRTTPPVRKIGKAQVRRLSPQIDPETHRSRPLKARAAGTSLEMEPWPTTKVVGTAPEMEHRKA